MKVLLNLNPDGSVTWSSASDAPEVPPEPTNPLPGSPAPTVPNPPPFPPPGPVLPPAPVSPVPLGTIVDPLPNIHSNISLDTAFDVNVNAVWMFSLPANATHAFKIVAVPGRFPPNGVQIETNQYGNNRVARKMCISDAPGSHTPITWNGGLREGIEGAYVAITLNSAQYGVVIIEPNREVWLNIWASLPDTPMDYMITPRQM